PPITPLPPISTLFPYTTLFRSYYQSPSLARLKGYKFLPFLPTASISPKSPFFHLVKFFSFSQPPFFYRGSLSSSPYPIFNASILDRKSTRLLQSRENLVCRLLL